MPSLLLRRRRRGLNRHRQSAGRSLTGDLGGRAIAQLGRHRPGLDEAYGAQPAIDPRLVKHPLSSRRPVAARIGRHHESRHTGNARHHKREGPQARHVDREPMTPAQRRCTGSTERPVGASTADVAPSVRDWIHRRRVPRERLVNRSCDTGRRAAHARRHRLGRRHRGRQGGRDRPGGRRVPQRRLAAVPRQGQPAARRRLRRRPAGRSPRLAACAAAASGIPRELDLAVTFPLLVDAGGNAIGLYRRAHVDDLVHFADGALVASVVGALATPRVRTPWEAAGAGLAAAGTLAAALGDRRVARAEARAPRAWTSRTTTR